MRKVRLIFACTAASICAVSGLVSADVDSAPAVDMGSVVTATIEMTIDSLFGLQTEIDSSTVELMGDGLVVLGPGGEPFSTFGMDTMEFRLGEANLEYEFFCAPIFGCQLIQVAAQNLTLTLLESTDESIGSGGSVLADASWNMAVDYQVSGDIFELSGSTEQTETVAFGCTVEAVGGDLAMAAMSLGDITATVDPAKLPTGVYGVTMVVAFDLSVASMSGSYEDAGVVGDLNGDGKVDGADLGLLLSQWGVAGNGDLNGDGTVNGADLGLMLAAWSV